MLRASEASGTTTLADLYLQDLAPYFAGPRHFWAHLVNSRRPRALAAERIAAVTRYLDDGEKALSRELAHLVEKKDEADRARALQGLLKGWLVVHAAVTGALLVLAVVHVVVVYRFGSGVMEDGTRNLRNLPYRAAESAVGLRASGRRTPVSARARRPWPMRRHERVPAGPPR